MSKFESLLMNEVDRYGGWKNYHAHIDRAFLLDPEYFEHADMDPWEIINYPLTVKQHVVGEVHNGEAFHKQSLEARMRHVLMESIEANVQVLNSAIDTTADIGMRALYVALDLKEEFENQIEFNIGAYPIFGFKDDDPDRWDTFFKGAEIADFIVSLPERDERAGHIGYKEHLRRVIGAADTFEIPLQVHVDQTNNPNEKGLETLIEAVRWLNPCVPVWAVHALSVASYDEPRFQRVIEGLKETGIGIIICPNATLSNKQDRSVMVPMHNSITRVLDFIIEGIPVRIGTDNIEDFMCPEGTNMIEEVKTAARATRFYNFTTWAKIGCGAKLTEVDKMKAKKAINGLG